MVETESLISKLQRLYFETEERRYMDELHDQLEIIAYYDELLEHGYTENAY